MEACSGLQLEPWTRHNSLTRALIKANKTPANNPETEKKMQLPTAKTPPRDFETETREGDAKVRELRPYGSESL